jgi:hypothetical protein
VGVLRSRESDEIQRLTAWQRTSEGMRGRLIAGAWRHGERNVAKIAKAIGVSRDTVYADLREHDIDYRDRRAPTIDDDALLEYEYISERYLDALLASSPTAFGLQALVTGYDTTISAGRCGLVESLLDVPGTETDEHLVRHEVSLRRGRLDVPELGDAAVWQATTTRPDGTTAGLGLIGLPAASLDGPATMLMLMGSRTAREAATAKLDDDGVDLAQRARQRDENPREAGHRRDPDPDQLQRGASNLAEAIALAPMLEAQDPKHCLIHSYGTAATPGLQWGDTVVDEVEIGSPIWIYTRHNGNA